MARDEWNATGAGTTAGVTVTKAAAEDRLFAASSIAVSGDLAALVTIESPASTILWRQRFTGAFAQNVPFPSPLRGAINEALLVKISASTANCEANISGITI